MDYRLYHKSGEAMMNIGKLSWKRVLTTDGVTIGEVQGGDVDTKTWQVTHLHIGLNDKTLKEFNLHKPFIGQVLICLPVDYIQKVDDAITLAKSLQELKETKECQEFVK
jgi:sporulation protein YlmC with PRC-barrel domain